MHAWDFHYESVPNFSQDSSLLCSHKDRLNIEWWEKKSASCNCRLIIHFLKLYLTKTYFNTTVSLCSDWHNDAAIHLILCLIKDHNVQFTELLKKAFRCNWVVANAMLYVYSIWCIIMITTFKIESPLFDVSKQN